jgi:hypothetical protein
LLFLCVTYYVHYLFPHVPFVAPTIPMCSLHLSHYTTCLKLFMLLSWFPSVASVVLNTSTFSLILLPKSYSFEEYSLWAMEMLYSFYLGSVQHWEMFQNSEIFFVVHLLYKSSKFIHVGIRFFRKKFIDDAHYQIMFSTLDVHTTN